MKATFRKDIKLNNTTKLYKNTDCIVVGVTWTEKRQDSYYVKVNGETYLVDKKDLDIFS